MKETEKVREVKLEGKSHVIREVDFSNNLSNIGKFFCETQRETCMFYNENDGVYIYQSHVDPNVGYRIYKEFADYGFNGYNDDKLIAKLNEKKHLFPEIKIPTGIITHNGNIIGQEIVLFLNHLTINDYSKKFLDTLPTDLYIQIINVIKKLYDCGIGYYDGHAKNFMVDRTTKHVEIIDFQWSMMSFDNIYECENWKIFDRMNSLINQCNENFRVNDIIPYAKIDNFSQAYEYVEESKHKLLKTNRYSK